MVGCWWRKGWPGVSWGGLEQAGVVLEKMRDGVGGKIKSRFLGNCGEGCPGRWGSPHPWRGSKTVRLWHLGTWFSRRGGAGVTVGLGHLRGLFQP